MASNLRTAPVVTDIGLERTPIEVHLRALGSDPTAVGLALCMLRIADSAPALLAVLRRAAGGERLSRRDGFLLFYGIYVLAGARIQETCAPLLALVQRRDRSWDDLLGDMVTRSLSKIMASVFDGQIEPLLALIADPTVDESVRGSLQGAATFLTHQGRIPRDQMATFLAEFYEQRLIGDGDTGWFGWIEAVGLLGLPGMDRQVEQVLSWIGDDVFDARSVRELMADAASAPADVSRFTQCNLGLVDDVVADAQWALPGPDEPEDEAWEIVDPIRNPLRGVGRNDPCPCGSGRKYKKCCLA